jgi:prepilin-type N-terminal cleavage/methylation domain-containing protein
MKKRAFTILEIVIAVVIVGIMATLGFPAYQRVVEDSNARACEVNLRALKIALDSYMMSHDAMPATIGELIRETAPVAYAEAAQEKSWSVKFGNLLLRLEGTASVFAIPPIVENKHTFKELAKGNLKMVICPKDPSKPTMSSARTSYGFNNALPGMTYGQYQAVAPTAWLIGDSDNMVGDNQVFASGNTSELRHNHRFSGMSVRCALVIQKDGTVIRVPQP